MNKQIRKAILGLCIAVTLTGCATTPNAGYGNTQPSDERARIFSKKSLWTVGGILLVGAILAHEGADGVRDSVRDAEVFRSDK